MSTNTRRTFVSRNPWALPLLLGLIVLGIILAFTLGPKLKSAASATATPTSAPTATSAPVKVVVTATPVPGAATATPGGPTATPGSGAPGAATATPGGAGGATPLPGATPQPTVPGIKIGMITRTQARVTQVQTGADKGDPNYTYYLDPTQVLQKNLGQYGFTQPFTVESPASASPTPTPFTGADGRPVVKYIVKYQGQEYTVQVLQPGTRGPKGIWVIATIFRGRQ